MGVHRYVHLGDLHLRPDRRNQGRRSVLAKIIREEKHRQVDAWIWPGDLNHGAMSIDDRNFLVSRLMAMAEQAPVVIIQGNHDRAGDLDIFQELGSVCDIVVVTQPSIIDVNDLVLFALPYPSKDFLLAGGHHGADAIVTGQSYLAELFEDASTALESAVKDGRPAMVAGHISVAGAVSSTGQPQIGAELTLDRQVLDGLHEQIYVGLNHIHKQQQVGRAHYAGSLCRLDWGELEDKSYTSVTYSVEASSKESSLEQIDRHAVDVPPMYHVEGELCDSGFEWTLMNAKDGPMPSFEGAEVRVRYRFPVTARAVVEALEPQIQERFKGAKRLVLEPIAIGTSVSRSASVMEATTLSQRISRWSELTTGGPLSINQLLKLDELQGVIEERGDITQDEAAVQSVVDILLTAEDS